MTTDLVLAEVQQENQWNEVSPYVESESLLKYSISDELLGKLMADPLQRRVGPADASALYVAREFDGILMTGDRQLRKQGELHKVEVHGVLWALDWFVEKNILKPVQAGKKLTEIQAKGALLPPTECKKRLKKWRS